MAGHIIRRSTARYQLYCLLLVLLPAAVGWAQLRYQLPADEMSKKINCLAQQPDKRLLLGTNRGLYLFNGVSFQLLPADTALVGDEVTAIEQGAAEPWVGMASGRLAQWRAGRLQLLAFEEGHFAKPITDIVADAQGRRWCATAGEGIYCYQQQRWYHIGTDDGLSDGYIYDLQALGQTMAAATDGGVNFIQFNGGQKRIMHLGMREGLPDNICLSLALAAPGKLVVAHQEKGISVLRWQEGTTPHLLYSTAQWRYGTVLQLQAGADRLYAATPDSGLLTMRWEANTLRLQQVQAGAAQHLLLDADQRLWASHAAQLTYWLHPQLRIWKSKQAANTDAIHAIHASPDGYWWHSEQNWVTATPWHDPEAGTVYTLPIAKGEAAITCLYRDATGVVWVGTMGRGIWLIHTATGTVRPLQLPGLPAAANVLSMTGNAQHVWLSSLEGLAQIDLVPAAANQPWWQQYQLAPPLQPPGIGTNYVYQIFADSKNRLWFATDGKGVTMVAGTRTKQYNTTQGLTGNVVYSFAEDAKGRIWMNVLNGGLCYIEGDSIRQLGRAQGLSTNNVASVMAAGNGNIVAVSAHAVDIIDANTLAVDSWDEQLLGGSPATDLHSSAAGPAEVLLAGSNGILQLAIPATVAPPAAFISSIELFMQPVDSARHAFAADEHFIGFHFDAVSFLHAAHLQFQYKLEGLATQWTSTRDRFISFPKLPPGSYRFVVRASVNGSFEQSPVYSFRFQIARPWWQQWWFIVLATGLLAGVVWWSIRWRERQQQRMQELQQAHLLSQLETLRNQVGPHFFFNSLNTLMALIEEDKPAALRYTAHLSDFFRKVVQIRDDHTIPLAQELALVNDYLYLQRQRFGDALQLENKLPEEQLATRRIAPLTLQLLVENAIKHNAFTAQQPLHIELLLQDGWLLVRNNCRPKLDRPPGEGMGLQHIRRRYRLLTNKEVMVQQSDQRFDVLIPLPDE